MSIQLALYSAAAKYIGFFCFHLLLFYFLTIAGTCYLQGFDYILIVGDSANLESGLSTVIDSTYVILDQYFNRQGSKVIHVK